MLGDALKISPVLDQGVTGTFPSYFPAGSWYDLNSVNENFYFKTTGD
jgi:alpha-glucosidase (family GH31 glycosyl hydrolase)